MAALGPCHDQYIELWTVSRFRYLQPNDHQELWLSRSGQQCSCVCRPVHPDTCGVWVQLGIRPIVSLVDPLSSEHQALGLKLTPDSDMRGETVIVSIGLHLSGHILNRIFTELSNRDVRYFGVVWTQIFASFSHPLNVAWMALVCRDSEERSLAMAMYVQGRSYRLYTSSLCGEFD